MKEHDTARPLYDWEEIEALPKLRDKASYQQWKDGILAYAARHNALDVFLGNEVDPFYNPHATQPWEEEEWSQYAGDGPPPLYLHDYSNWQAWPHLHAYEYEYSDAQWAEWRAWQEKELRMRGALSGTWLGNEFASIDKLAMDMSDLERAWTAALMYDLVRARYENALPDELVLPLIQGDIMRRSLGPPATPAAMRAHLDACGVLVQEARALKVKPHVSEASLITLVRKTFTGTLREQVTRIWKDEFLDPSERSRGTPRRIRSVSARRRAHGKRSVSSWTRIVTLSPSLSSQPRWPGS